MRLRAHLLTQLLDGPCGGAKKALKDTGTTIKTRTPASKAGIFSMPAPPRDGPLWPLDTTGAVAAPVCLTFGALVSSWLEIHQNAHTGSRKTFIQPAGYNARSGSSPGQLQGSACWRLGASDAAAARTRRAAAIAASIRNMSYVIAGGGRLGRGEGALAKEADPCRVLGAELGDGGRGASAGREPRRVGCVWYMGFVLGALRWAVGQSGRASRDVSGFFRSPGVKIH